jgi:hypothetical protein
MTETLLILIIALLSVNLIFVGIYIVLVLKEVRGAIARMNEILESISAISAAVATPVVGAAGAVSAFTEGLKAFNKLQSIRKRVKKKAVGTRQQHPPAEGAVQHSPTEATGGRYPANQSPAQAQQYEQ